MRRTQENFFPDTMEGQIDHDFLNKAFSIRLESDDADEIHTFQQRMKW